MVNLIFNYLLESSLCLILFMVAYRILIANLTNFQWMRFYLLVSTALSLVLPLIILPIEWSAKLVPTDSFSNVLLIPTKQIATTIVNNDANLKQAVSELSVLKTILFVAFIIYMIGTIYCFYLFARKLLKMNAFIKKSSKVKEENYWIVRVKSEIPAFSFFNYIFISNTHKNLSPDELDVIKKHEIEHVKQYHTLDILFTEFVGILFWFNPIVNYLKKSLKEIHEYIVDERIAGHGETKKAYARLLLTLTTDAKPFDLAASFTGEHIKRRIQMLAKPRTSLKHNLLFFVLIPLAALALLSFSCLKDPETNSNPDSYREQNKVTGIELGLKKYCGIYFPLKGKFNFGLKPMVITLKGNRLFANGSVALHFEADSIFSYTDNSARSIKFDLDTKKEVAGCALVQFVTKERTNYIVLEGEYLKDKRVK